MDTERNKCMIIAEAGVNHNGSKELAFRLCDAAKASGADVVKFQTWKTENIITRHVSQAEYQRKNMGKEESQFDMLKRLELSYADYEDVKKHCDNIGISFTSTADDEESLAFIISLGVPFLKVSSGDIGNVSFLRKIGHAGLPVILSSGMSTLAEVGESVEVLREAGAKEITVLHCTTNYPCPVEEVNLKAMLTLREAFKVPVGYSDHTIGIEVPVSAVALGASVIEKHFTLDKRSEGPDHKASTEPEEFGRLVKAIRNIEAAMGDGIKRPTVSEREIQKVVSKRIVAGRMIKEGEIITEKDICVKRNDTGLKAKYWDMVIGTIAGRNYDIDEGVGFRDEKC